MTNYTLIDPAHRGWEVELILDLSSSGSTERTKGKVIAEVKVGDTNLCIVELDTTYTDKYLLCNNLGVYIPEGMDDNNYMVDSFGKGTLHASRLDALVMLNCTALKVEIDMPLHRCIEGKFPEVYLEMPKELTVEIDGTATVPFSNSVKIDMNSFEEWLDRNGSLDEFKVAYAERHFGTIEKYIKDFVFDKRSDALEGYDLAYDVANCGANWSSSEVDIEIDGVSVQ